LCGRRPAALPGNRVGLGRQHQRPSENEIYSATSFKESGIIQKHLGGFSELSKPIQSVGRLKNEKEEERRMNSLGDELALRPLLILRDTSNTSTRDLPAP
jgi:hypothetical protein